MISRASVLIAALAFLPAEAAAQGHIYIIPVDAADTGFFDPTPATPVGGNAGVTLGQQRTLVFERAAAIWEGTLKPRTDVYVVARFIPLGPNVLGSAGTTYVFRDFPGAEYPGTWYHSALADNLAGEDLNPGYADISASFSTQFPFYLGFDNAEPAGTVDLLPVVLHELGHGLGFANFVNESTGTLLAGLKDIYSEYTQDVSTGKRWNDMTDVERQTSAINLRKVSWDGKHVNAAVPEVLRPGEPALVFASPRGLGPFAVGAASFGAPLSWPGVTGTVVLGIDPADAAGASTTDGCSPLTQDVTGKVVLLDRGTCGFVVKVKNAQNAGAIAVLIADNAVSEPPPGLGGADPTITITAVRISLPAGDAVKAALAAGENVSGTLGVDNSILAGTDRIRGLMLLAALNPVAPGSSISHFDAVASPNQLMEPAINADLTSSVSPPEDLTSKLMVDVGWFSDADGVPDGRDACLGSSQTPTVEIQACVSTATNTVFTDGCRVSDFVGDCATSTRSHGGFVGCVERLGKRLERSGVLTSSQQKSLQKCAEKSNINKDKER